MASTKLFSFRAIVSAAIGSVISADVNVHLVKEITDKIKEKANDEKIKGIEKREQLIKLLYDTILEIIGGEKKEIVLNQKKQTRIMLLGLYGAGKSTTAGKLGLYYSKREKRVALLGLDVHRPAASDQLEQLAKQNKLAVFIDKDEKSAIKIYKKYSKEFSIPKAVKIFNSLIRGKDTDHSPLPDINDAVIVIKILDSIEKSIRTKEPVRV